MTVQQWTTIELSYSDSHAKKSAECGISAQFTAPSGRVILRSAFWDGGDCFKIRFAPTEAGQWLYTVRGLSSGESSGTLEAVPYQGENAFYRHGFLKVGPKGRYLCHADNTPFFWLGDTHWHFAIREKWDESNDPRFDSQFKAIVDKRAAQKFNIYQCNFHCEYPLPVDSDIPAYFTETADGLIPNLDFLQNNLDKKMQYLAEKGFGIAIGLTWFFSIFAPGAVDFYKAAVRYLIARYGSYPVLWTLAGEVGGYSASMREQSIALWREIALEIEKQDSYHHLQTAHYTNERPFPVYYQGESWFDFTLNQSGHGDYPIDSRPFRAHRKAFPSTPFIESESMYENVLTLEPNGRRRATPEMLRRVAYISMQSGACGYTYGAQGMWHLQWDEPNENEPGLGFGSFDPWHRAIDFPGAGQMTLMRDFYEAIGWSRLKPLEPSCFAPNTQGAVVITFSDEELQALFMPSVSADDDMTTLVAYYSSTNRFQVGFRTLTQPLYKAQWFHPATGEYTLIDDAVRPDNGIWFAPVKPVAEDCILLLTAK